jgi:D-arabinose 1-dehydrogenase-like Zn-dependent alcohol dehydrogenase
VDCDDCKNTGIQYCDHKGGKPGITMDGNFAEYLLADSNNVLPLPEELDFTDAVHISIPILLLLSLTCVF